MRRFLFFSLPLLVLTMAVFQFALEASHQTALLTSDAALPGWIVLGTWLLEAIALSCLYLLIHPGGGGRFFNGLVTGWIAWVFRGPLLVISVATLARQPPGPWWSLTFRWWILYTGCGLLLGAVAGVAELPAASAPAPVVVFRPPVRPPAEASPRQWLDEPAEEAVPAAPLPDRAEPAGSGPMPVAEASEDR